jgi:hypothetical protein
MNERARFTSISTSVRDPATYAPKLPSALPSVPTWTSIASRQAFLLCDAGAAGPEHAGRVCFVDHEPAAAALRLVDDLAQRCAVAVHREDRLRHYERASRVRVSIELLGEMSYVVVAINREARAREPAPVDDARMIELVADDHVVGGRRAS